MHALLLALQQAVEHHNPLWEAVQGAMVGGGGWWVFSTAIRTMPQPQPLERWYGWAHSFLQLVAANHDKRKVNGEKDK